MMTSIETSQSYEWITITAKETTDFSNHNTTYPQLTLKDYSLSCVYCITAGFILFGNALVIASTVRFRYLRTTTNIYILFLSCSDVTVSLSLVYGGAYVLNQVSWNRYGLLCVLRYCLLIYSITVSVNLHVGKFSKCN